MNTQPTPKNRAILIQLWPSVMGSDSLFDEDMFVTQCGYDGGWLRRNDPRYAKLKPVLDLMEPENDAEWDEYKTYYLSVAEWDAITDGALLP